MTIMPSDKKYSLWPAVIIVCLAFGLPLAIGTMEVRIARNAHAEAEAVAQLQDVSKAEIAYREANHRYSGSLEELNGLNKPDPAYRYQYNQLSPETYAVTAEPLEPGKHGKRYFYLDQSGVIRYEVLHPASAGSAVVPVKAEEKRAGGQ